MEPQKHTQYEPLASEEGIQHPTGSSASITMEPDRDDEQPTATGNATSQDIALEPLVRPQASSQAETQALESSLVLEEVHRKQPKQTVMTWLEDSWVLELLAAVLSAAALLSIFGILMHFDNQPQPTWPHMSLNTVVSWLGTVARGCILLLLSRSIGQLKWIWLLQGPRRALSDVKTFDAASRGALGSVELIVMQRVVLSFAFDPFLQNLVHTSLRSVPDPLQTAYLANTSLYDSVGPRLGTADQLIDPVMKSNVYSSLFNNDPLQPWAIPQFQCNTGNCTWNDTTTLTVSYACQDITSSLVKDCELLPDDVVLSACARSPNPKLDICNEICYISLPKTSDYGPRFYATYYPKAGYFGEAMVLSSRSEVASWSHLGSIAPLATISMISANASLAGGGMEVELRNDTLWRATECTIYPCVRQVSSHVDDAIYTETFTTFDHPATGEKMNAWCQNEDRPGMPSNATLWPLWLDPEERPAERAFGFDTYISRAINIFLAEAFQGNVTLSALSLDWDVPKPSRGVAYANGDILEAIYYGNMSGCEFSTNHLECAMSNAARAMTKSLRDSAYIKAGLLGANMTIGYTFVGRTYVTISWYWFSVPILIWLLAIVSWLVALLKTRILRAPIWRNNPLPHFFLRQSDAEDHQPQDISSRGYTERSRSILTQLHVREHHAHMD